MSKPKFQVGDVVVITSMYPDGDNHWFDVGVLSVGKEYTIKSLTERQSNIKWCISGTYYCIDERATIVDESMLTLASDYYKQQEKENMEQNLNNTKIDVAAYAEQYGLTLEQANNEIIAFVKASGCTPFSKDTRPAIWVSVYPDKEFTRTYPEDMYPPSSQMRQIFLERNIVLTIKQEPATIEIDGVKYDKQSVMKAIKNFEITE